MDAARCNIFKNVWDRDCKHIAHHMLILEAIAQGRWRSHVESIRNEKDKDVSKELKWALPCVTFSGVFNERNASGIAEYSQVVVMDIDNIGSKLKTYKKRLSSDPSVAAFFESPSRGLKALFQVSVGVELHRDHSFPVIQKHLKDMHGIEADPSGKDVSRLCFVSYDPDLYYNPEATIFDVGEPSFKRDFRGNIDRLPGNKEYTYDTRVIFETCDKMTKGSKTGSYGKGNRNNYIYSLSCNLNRAGIDSETALHLIFGRYPSLGIEEIKSTIGSAYRHHKDEFGNNRIYQNKSNELKLFSNE